MAGRAETISAAEVAVYTIRVKGHLDDRWRAWFENLRLEQQPDGCTVLAGPIADQAALHGILARIRDLGLPLLSVSRVEPRSR